MSESEAAGTKAVPPELPGTAPDVCRSVQATPARADASSRVRHLLTAGLLATAGVFFGAGLFFDRTPICGLVLLGRPLLLSIGWLVAAAAIGLPRRWPALGLGLWVLLVSFLVLVNLAGYLAGMQGQFLWNVPFRTHPAYGHAGVPNTTGLHWLHPDFRARYSFDDQGWRVMPRPKAPRGEVLMLGCSYTFGTGVQDDETYPAVLATEFWPNYRVVNRGFPMFGTVECWVVLEEFLAREPLPRAVCYGFIDDHLRRNWLRQSWHAGKRAWGAKVHHVEVENGTLVDHGLVDPSLADKPDSDATLAHEEAITIALVERMAADCRRKQVPFYLLALNQRYPITNRVVAAAQAAGVDVIDLREVNNSFFPHDTHPTAEWDAAIAAAIAADPRMAKWGAR